MPDNKLLTIRPTARAPAPKHLSARCKKLWAELLSRFELDPHHLELLRLALEAIDRCEQARQVIAKQGLIATSKDGTIKPHPATGIERDARLAAARLFRELNLDAAIGEEAARPPRIGGGHGSWRPGAAR